MLNRLIYFLFLYFFAGAQVFAQSLEPIKIQQKISERETPLNFLGINSAMRAYVGSWQGRQSLFEPTQGGKKIADFSVTQRYILNDDENILECRAVVSDSRGNDSVFISEIKEQDGELLLSFVIGAKKVPLYRGIIKGNSVLWFPYHMFLLLNIQEDKFFLKKQELFMYSDGLQHIRNDKKQYEGILSTNAVFKKVERIEPVKKETSIKLSPRLDKNFFKKRD